MVQTGEATDSKRPAPLDPYADRSQQPQAAHPRRRRSREASPKANTNGDPRSSLISRGEANYELAAFLLLNAIDGKKRRPPRPGLLAQKIAAFHYKNAQRLKVLAMMGLLLTCFERPDWCIGPDGPTGICESHLYPSYHMPYLPHRWDLAIEACFIILIFLDTAGILYANGSGYDCARLVLVVLNGFDLFFHSMLPTTWFRMATYIRLGYVYTYLPDVQTGIELAASTLPAIGKILFLLGMYIVFFGWLGVILFPVNTEEGVSYFPNLGTGCWSLLILITTANYPDVMMPAYTENRAAFIFFLAFLLFGFFFLVNLLTAAVFTCYESHECQTEEDAEKSRQDNLAASFLQLAGEDGEITFDTMLDFFEVLNSFHVTGHISNQDARDMISQLNSDGEGGIADTEWMLLFKVLESRFKDGDAGPPALERFFPNLIEDRRWNFLKKFCHHQLFDYFIDLVLIISVGVTAAETWDSIIGSTTKVGHMTRYAWLDTVFCLIFMVEVGLKVITEGFWRYWRQVKHRFDFVITLVMAIAAFCLGNPAFAKYVAILRIFRLLRLLLHVQAYETIVETFGQMLPKSVKVIKVLVCFLYLFSVLGIQLFGGLISTDPQSPFFAKVDESSFGEAGFYPNNFNDMPSAVVTLFELLIVNNWFEISDGFVATSGYTSRIYFVAFYVVGIVVVLNIVVASVLNTYSSISEEKEREIMKKESSYTSQHKIEEREAQEWVRQQVKSDICTWCELKMFMQQQIEAAARQAHVAQTARMNDHYYFEGDHPLNSY